MTRPGATARRSVALADASSDRLPPVRDEAAGTRRTLFLVFSLLVAVSGVAAFAIGGLITLRSDADEPERLPAAPEQLAIMVGQLATASPQTTVPDPFEMMLQPTPSPTNPGGVLVPPIIGLTEAPDGNDSAQPGSSNTAGPAGTATAPPTTGCAPGSSSPSPTASTGTGGAGGSVSVLPLTTPCP